MTCPATQHPPSLAPDFSPNRICDLKVKGLAGDYSEWSVLRWTAPPFAPASEFVEIVGTALPSRAKPVGHEADGTPLYLGRAFYQGSMQPGNYRQGWGKISISFGGQELWAGGAAVWVGILNGANDNGFWRPPDAAQAASVVGWEGDQTKLYAARTWIEGGLHVGKWRRDWAKASIPYGGREFWAPQFEVLCGS
jgi:hypothetical protein